MAPDDQLTKAGNRNRFGRLCRAVWRNVPPAFACPPNTCRISPTSQLYRDPLPSLRSPLPRPFTTVFCPAATFACRYRMLRRGLPRNTILPHSFILPLIPLAFLHLPLSAPITYLLPPTLVHSHNPSLRRCAGAHPFERLPPPFCAVSRSYASPHQLGSHLRFPRLPVLRRCAVHDLERRAPPRTTGTLRAFS